MFFTQESCVKTGSIKNDLFSGADLSALVREASEFALKEFIKNPCSENELVKLKHFEMAFNKIKPSVSLKVSSFILFI
jgi:SpoVK/Ycf46/Vps4 family AAA+-type ATPase